MSSSVLVFGFPYAGGNAYAYRPLEALLSPGLEMRGLELPGRGRRIGEPLVRSLEALADDACGQLRSQLAGRPRYALFGHSMGAALAYLCLQRIAAASLPGPETVFLSGYGAPSMLKRKTRHLLPHREFVEMLSELGGCPPEILREPELVEHFEPILRADFQAVETWVPAASRPLPVPLVVLRGRDDDVSREQAMGWRDCTTAGFECHDFDGDHFFIQRHWREIAALIGRRLGCPVQGVASTAWA